MAFWPRLHVQGCRFKVIAKNCNSISLSYEVHPIFIDATCSNTKGGVPHLIQNCYRCNIQPTLYRTRKPNNLLTFHFQPSNLPLKQTIHRLRTTENCIFYIFAAEGILERSLNILSIFPRLEVAHD